MKDSFFLGNGKKRSKGKKQLKKRDQSSDDEPADVDNLDLKHEEISSASEDELQETPAQKRLRLAKQYLSNLKEETDEILEGEIDAKELDRDLIAERLLKDTKEAKGISFMSIAEKYSVLEMSPLRTFKSKKCQQKSLTSICYSPSGFLYTGSKDSIVKWNIKNAERLHLFANGKKKTKRIERRKLYKATDGHNNEILCVDASSDGRFMVSGGLDRTIRVWSTEDNSQIGKFTQHRDAVTALKFRRGHNDLYSSSFDRTVKVWNVEEMSYIETLFGHQDKITDIDSLQRERALTCGSRDRTCRMWKIVEESQLVFRGGGGGISITEDLVVLEELSRTGQKREKDNGLSGGSIDTVTMIDEEYFVCGSDSGAISLWSIHKKKPIFTKLNCHGAGSRIIENGKESIAPPAVSDGLHSNDVPNWITAVRSVPYTDMFASGSADGFIKLWKLSDSKKSFTLFNCIPAVGFCNDMTFFTDKDWDQPNDKRKYLYLAVALGQEHRLGRWWKVKNGKNQALLFKLGVAIN